MRATVALGLVAVTFGFTVVLRRGLAAPFGSMSYAFVTLVGALALVQGLRYANGARDVEPRATETADVEERYEVPAPGGDVDDLFAGLGGLSAVSIRRRRDLHERVRLAARDTLLARGGYDESGVEDALSDGTWTDDPVAAWFLGTDLALPPAVRLRGLLGSDVAFTFAAERTIAALAAVQAGEADPGEADAAGPPRGQPRDLVSDARAVGRRHLRALRNRVRRVSR